MTNDHGHVVLVTGDAPYLGGPATWLPLRRAASELQFVEVDLLEAADGVDPIDAAREMVRKALPGALAVVVHGTAASITIEAIAAIDPSIPVLLVSPRIITRQSLLLRGVRALAGGIGGNFLNAFARSKRRRLLADKPYIRKQLALLVRNDAITDELMGEAYDRIADPRMDLAVARTAETLRGILRPVDARANAAVSNREVLLGEGPMDRKARARGSATVLQDAWSAPMLEAPHAVAAHLHSLLAATGSLNQHETSFPGKRPL